MKKANIFIFSCLAVFFSSCGEGNNDNFIEGTGTLETKTVIISSQVMGQIKDIIKNDGELVVKGDTLLIVDPINYFLQLEQASAARDAAEAQLLLLKKGTRDEDLKQAEEVLTQVKTSFVLAESDKERFENLYKEQAVTKKQLDDIVARYDIAKAQYNAALENMKKIKNIARPEEIKQAEANLNRANAGVNLILKSINDCYVSSPITGTIVEKFVETGELISPMSSLYKISNLENVELVVYISEVELGKVKLGQPADISVDAFPGKSYRGKIIYISPEAEFTPKNIQTKDERTKLVFAVKIGIPNSNYELKNGMPADAKIFFN